MSTYLVYSFWVSDVLDITGKVFRADLDALALGLHLAVQPLISALSSSAAALLIGEVTQMQSYTISNM